VREVFDLLALDHVTVADEGDRCDTKPCNRILNSPQVLQSLLVAQRFDLRSETMTDIGNRAVEDLAVGTIRLAQQQQLAFCAM